MEKRRRAGERKQSGADGTDETANEQTNHDIRYITADKSSKFRHYTRLQMAVMFVQFVTGLQPTGIHFVSVALFRC